MLLVRRVPPNREVEAAQEAARPGMVSAQARPGTNALSTTEGSGFYELLPDTFVEPEAGLLPHQHVGGQLNG